MEPVREPEVDASAPVQDAEGAGAGRSPSPVYLPGRAGAVLEARPARLRVRYLRLFGGHVSLLTTLLVFSELALFVGGAYGAAWLRFDGDMAAAQAWAGPLGPRAAVIALALAAGMAAMGLYQRDFREDWLGTGLRAAVGLGLGALLLTLVYYALPDLEIGRGILALTLALALPGSLGLRALHFGLLGERGLRRRVLVLGAGTQAATLLRLRRRADRRGFEIVAFVSVRGEDAIGEGGRVIPHDRPLARIVRRHEIDEVVVAVDERRGGLPIHELLDCRLGGVQVVDLATFFERETGRIKLESLSPSWLVFEEGFHHGWLRDRAKRIFDVAVSLALLVLASPLMLLAALAVRLDSPGPVLFRQVRVGQHGRPFELLKFRSMRADAEADGRPRWATRGDPRITRVGRFLRKARIDELPQLVNVLRGEMSFVGPRPERPEFVRELAAQIPYYNERHRVKPGITGWAQICYGYTANERDAREKLEYDLYYVKNYSPLFDLYILLRTVEVVLWGRGAH